MNTKHTARPKVLVLGTGFAAFSFVRSLNLRHYDVVVVSPRNHFLFTPLLPSTTVGTIEFRSIIEPIRAVHESIRYYQAVCVGIDRDKKVAHCEGAFQARAFDVEYDYLVVAVGVVSSTFNIPGVTEHAYFLKELSDARQIRQKIIECFERASQPGRTDTEIRDLLHFVVVGGGPTGVEFAAELHDFAVDELSKWFLELRPSVRITLIEASKDILSSFDASLSAYAKKHFLRSDIQLRTNARVNEVRADGVLLEGGEVLPCGLTVWSTGIGPTSLARDLEFKKDQRNRIVTNEQFLVHGTENIYALGDAACIENSDLPATAQVAQQAGAYLAKQFNRRAKNKPVEPFTFKQLGMLAYIGGNRAVADFKSHKSHGYGTWLLWRSAYLTKLVSLKNKLNVFVNWTSAALFGRDISRF